MTLKLFLHTQIGYWTLSAYTLLATEKKGFKLRYILYLFEIVY